MNDHNCFDHLEYDSHEWVEPHGERCIDEWYRCTICFRIYTVPEADRMFEAEVSQ